MGRRRPSSASPSIAAAYVAMRFNNIMDMLQLVFAFVNAPLFATFLLGMFWKRATGHGAFSGWSRVPPRPPLDYELSGQRGAAVRSLPTRAIVHVHPSDMGAELSGGPSSRGRCALRCDRGRLPADAPGRPMSSCAALSIGFLRSVQRNARRYGTSVPRFWQ